MHASRQVACLLHRALHAARSAVRTSRACAAISRACGRGVLSVVASLEGDRRGSGACEESQLGVFLYPTC